METKLTKNDNSLYVIIERAILFLVLLFRIDGDLEENDIFFFIAILLSCLGIMLILLSKERRERYPFSYVKWQFIFIGFSALSYFWAYDRDITRTFIIALLGRYIVLSYYWFFLSRTNDLGYFVKSFVTVVIISALHLTFFYGLGRFMASRTQELGNIHEGWNSNAICTTYTLGIFLYLYWFYIRNKRKTIGRTITPFEFLTMPFMILVFIIVLLSGSKTGLFYLIVPMMLYYILSHKSKVASALLIFVVGYVGYYLLMNVSFLYLILGSRIESFINGFFRNNTTLSISDTTRINLINGGVEWFLQKPMYGWGLSNFRSLMHTNLYSHNNYIEQLVSTGIIGLIIYYSGYLYLLIKAFLNRKEKWAQIVISLIVPLMVIEYGFVSYLAMQMQLILLLCFFAEKYKVAENDN